MRQCNYFVYCDFELFRKQNRYSFFTFYFRKYHRETPKILTSTFTVSNEIVNGLDIETRKET